MMFYTQIRLLVLSLILLTPACRNPVINVYMLCMHVSTPNGTPLWIWASAFRAFKRALKQVFTCAVHAVLVAPWGIINLGSLGHMRL